MIMLSVMYSVKWKLNWMKLILQLKEMRNWYRKDWFGFHVCSRLNEVICLPLRPAKVHTIILFPNYSLLLKFSPSSPVRALFHSINFLFYFIMAFAEDDGRMLYFVTLGVSVIEKEHLRQEELWMEY